MSSNIFLIGLMGSGKTTVGRKLSNLLGFDFIDIDQALIERTGVTISHIFEVEGEDGFRDRESKALKEISEMENVVVSTGGGIVVRSENLEIMRNHGTVVFLDVPIRVLWNRLKDCQHRPLLQVDEPRKRVAQLIDERTPLYLRAADIHLKVASDSANRTAKRIQQKLAQIGVSNAARKDQLGQSV
ncbi:MAG: shikimate kinase [bacterium]